MPICPYCSNEVAWDAVACPRCGKRKPADESGLTSAGSLPTKDELFSEPLMEIGTKVGGIGGALIGGATGLFEGFAAGGIGGAILFGAVGAVLGGLGGSIAGAFLLGMVPMFLAIAALVAVVGAVVWILWSLWGVGKPQPQQQPTSYGPGVPDVEARVERPAQLRYGPGANYEPVSITLRQGDRVHVETVKSGWCFVNSAEYMWVECDALAPPPEGWIDQPGPLPRRGD